MATIQSGDVQFEKIQAVVWDKDGTLANSQDFLRNLGRKRSRLIDAQIPGVQEPLLMAFGLESDRLNPAGLLAVGTRRENEIAAAAYVAETGRDWIEAQTIVRSAFSEAEKVLKRKADSTPLFPGALETLQDFLAAGVKLAIVSSDTTENVQDFVSRYGLNALIQLALGSDGEWSKPDPNLFHQACDQLGVMPEATLAIGDSQSDIEMARSAGAAGCVCVSWGWSTKAQLHQANSLIHSFSELRAIA